MCGGVGEGGVFYYTPLIASESPSSSALCDITNFCHGVTYSLALILSPGGESWVQNSVSFWEAIFKKF